MGIRRVVIVACLVAGLCVGGCTKTQPPRAKTPPAAVETQPIRRASLSDIRSFVGSLEASSSFVVAPKISGRLRSLHVDMGDKVERGQPIALIEDDEYVLAVEQAAAELRVAEANAEEAKSALEASRRELERVRALRTKHIASEADLDSATAQYESRLAKYKLAQAQVEQKAVALKTAEVRLSYTRIIATWEGGAPIRVVGERFADAGALLSAGVPLVSLVDIDFLRAVIYVTERDYSRMKLREPAEISVDAYPGRTFHARISRIAPVLKEQTRSARVELEVANPERLLKPGMFARVRIALESRADVVAVPVAAIARRSGQEGIFLVEKRPPPETSTVRLVPVRLGIIQGELAEVLEPEGLSGEVVTLGHHLLEDGSPVLVRAKDSR